MAAVQGLGQGPAGDKQNPHRHHDFPRDHNQSLFLCIMMLRKHKRKSEYCV